LSVNWKAVPSLFGKPLADAHISDLNNLSMLLPLYKVKNANKMDVLSYK